MTDADDLSPKPPEARPTSSADAEPESESGLDIESDALLDSLLSDTEAPEAEPPAAPALDQAHEFDDDEEVTGIVEPRLLGKLEAAESEDELTFEAVDELLSEPPPALPRAPLAPAAKPPAAKPEASARPGLKPSPGKASATTKPPGAKPSGPAPAAPTPGIAKPPLTKALGAMPAGAKAPAAPGAKPPVALPPVAKPGALPPPAAKSPLGQPSAKQTLQGMRPAAIPRPGALPPRPVVVRQPSLTRTAEPPSVNPPGLTPREPFLPATSPVAPRARVVPEPELEEEDVTAKAIPSEIPAAGVDRQSSLGLADQLEPEAATAHAGGDFEDLDEDLLESVPPPRLQDRSSETLDSLPPGSEPPPASEPLRESESPPPSRAHRESAAASESEPPRASDAPPESDPLSGPSLESAPAPSFTALARAFADTMVEDEATELLDSLPDEALGNYPSERPAADHLQGAARALEWRRHAEWFERQAHSMTDPAAKARALLVASEHFAQLGELAKARAVANEMHAVQPALALGSRQLRWLAAAEHDYKAVSAILELETRAAPTPLSRAHAANLASDIHRICFDDATNARRKLDLAQRLLPEDPRPYLLRLAEQLGQNPGPPRLRPPEIEELSVLGRVTRDLERLRSPGKPSDEATATHVISFEEARRNLRAGNAGAVLDALGKLGRARGMQRAALWLSAVLGAPSKTTRERALVALRELIGKYKSSVARQALAARALEQGDSESSNSALTDEDGLSPAFDAATRLALITLTSGAPLRTDLEELAEGKLRPLAVAAARANATLKQEPEWQVGSGEQQDQLETAHALASVIAAGPNAWNAPEALDQGALGRLREAFGAMRAERGPNPLTQILTLEFALGGGDAAKVAEVIGEWPGMETGPAKALSGALVLEASGERAAAKELFQKAIELDPQHEGATRALLVDSSPAEAAELLARLADSNDDPTQVGFLLLEAALLRSDDPQASEQHLVQAATSAPDLPLVYLHGEQQARQRGDAELLLSWLRQRRENATDSIDKAFDFVREALLVADSDMDLGASLLADAVAARPDDVALQQLHERLGSHAGVERGKWRERVAKQLEGVAKQRLLCEAMLEYERAGDFEAALAVSRLADEADHSVFGRLNAERLQIVLGQTAELSESLMKLARSESDAIKQREIYERLSELDERKGDRSSALLWQSAILERNSSYLPALRRLEHEYISTARWDDLEPIALDLGRQLDASEADARAIWVSQHRILSGRWEAAREAIALTSQRERPSLWALRAFAAQARGSDDLESVLATELLLIERARTPLDIATLCLRAAEAATRLGRLEEGKALLQRAIQQAPHHLVALTTLADVLDAMGAAHEAAEALEAAASAYQTKKHQVELWHQAAVLWQDSVNDQERAVHALEAALERDVTHPEALRRLQDIYILKRETDKLAELLERRLATTEDPAERVSIEVMRGQALYGIGDRRAAKEALSAALDANPEHAEALDAFANLCMEEGDYGAAEQAFIRLARHVGDPTQQASIYAKLGALYDEQLPNPARAEMAYQEVLKRDPENTHAMQRLVSVYVTLGESLKAIELQERLIARAETDEQRRDTTLELARVVERVSDDPKQALKILEDAKKTYGNDSRVLRAHAELLLRRGEDRAASLLLDRAANDSRRALSTGRFDTAFFETLSTVSELRGAMDAAVVAQATLAALKGEASELPGAGPRASDPDLDHLLAPAVLSPALRSLLKKAGHLLDEAYPVDLKALRARPLLDEALQLRSHVEQVALSFGISGIEVFASDALGSICMPLSTSPPRILYGQSLLDSDQAVARYFLLIRALKIIQTGSPALCRTAPIDLWPLLAGFLNIFAANWEPQGADARKTAQATQRIRAVMPAQLDSDVPVLALEVIGSIGNRASQLGVATNQFGNRAGLLAVGDPTAALEAVFLAAGQDKGLPGSTSERLKWVVRNSEARDLAVFSVSDQYFQAREALGVQAT